MKSAYHFLLLLALLVAYAEGEETVPNSILIEDFQDLSDWQISGAKEVKLIDDPDAGRCLQWASTSRNGTTMVKDLTSIKERLGKCDAIVFEYWLNGYMSCPSMRLCQVPGYDRARNWYFKFSNRRPRTWRTAHFELGLDDDCPSNDKDPITRLVLNFSGWQTGPEPYYEWRVRNLRVVSYPVTIDYDETQKGFEERGGAFVYRYDLEVKNRDNRDHECTIVVDRSRLEHFSAEATEEPFVVKAGQVRMVSAKLSIPTEKAAELEPLYLEEAPVFLRVTGLAETDTTVMRGWQSLPLFGAVPPRFAGGDRPRARCDATRLAQLRDWCRRVPEFMSALAWFKSAADAAVRAKSVYPTTAGGYSMGFLCPKCKADLRAQSLTQQYCPGCKKAIVGNKALNHKAVTAFHSRNAQDVYHCGLTHAITGEEAYAARAREILLKYAEMAPTMKVVNPLATGYSNVFGWAMLGESYLCTGFPWGYDFLMAAGALSEEESARIENGLLLPMLKRMTLHNASYSNQTAEYRSNQMHIALACGHWVMAARALNWHFGSRELVEFAFDEDGWTVEGSRGYQTGAVVCLEELSEAAHFAGADVYADEKYQKILKLADFPALLFARYYDPFAADKLQRRSVSRYDNSHVWFFATPKRIPKLEVGGLGLKSTVREGTGYTFLRLGLPEDFTGVDVNWGQTWERSEHDLFSYRVYLHGRRVDSEVGRIAYTNEYCYFMDKSIASSGIVVDQGNCTINRQLSCLIEGGDRFAACMVTTHPSRPLYEGVAMTRYFISLPQGVLVADVVDSKTEHDLDWPFFPPAKPKVSLGEMKAIEWEAKKGSGYDVPYDLKAAATDGAFWLQWSVGKAQVRMTVAGGEAKEVVFGTTHGKWNGASIPFLAIRKRGMKRSVAVAFFEEFGKEAGLSGLSYEVKDGRLGVTAAFTEGDPKRFELRPPQIRQGKLVPPSEVPYVSLSLR